MKKRNLVKVVGDALAEHLEQNGPVTAVFAPFAVKFPVIATENEAILRLAYKAPGQVSLQLGVYRKGTDRLYSNFMSAATSEEMIRCLRDPETQTEWLEQIEHLSKKADDFWD